MLGADFGRDVVLGLVVGDECAEQLTGNRFVVCHVYGLDALDLEQRSGLLVRQMICRDDHGAAYDIAQSAAPDEITVGIRRDVDVGGSMLPFPRLLFMPFDGDTDVPFPCWMLEHLSAVSGQSPPIADLSAHDGFDGLARI